MAAPLSCSARNPPWPRHGDAIWPPTAVLDAPHPPFKHSAAITTEGLSQETAVEVSGSFYRHWRARRILLTHRPMAGTLDGKVHRAPSAGSLDASAARPCIRCTPVPGQPCRALAIVAQAGGCSFPPVQGRAGADAAGKAEAPRGAAEAGARSPPAWPAQFHQSKGVRGWRLCTLDRHHHHHHHIQGQGRPHPCKGR